MFMNNYACAKCGLCGLVSTCILHNHLDDIAYASLPISVLENFVEAPSDVLLAMCHVLSGSVQGCARDQRYIPQNV
jgi:hypothetical protein